MPEMIFCLKINSDTWKILFYLPLGNVGGFYLRIEVNPIDFVTLDSVKFVWPNKCFTTENRNIHEFFFPKSSLLNLIFFLLISLAFIETNLRNYIKSVNWIGTEIWYLMN